MLPQHNPCLDVDVTLGVWVVNEQGERIFCSTCKEVMELLQARQTPEGRSEAKRS